MNDAYVEEMKQPDLEPEVKPQVCGHINRHSLDVKGQPDNMTCLLPKGHEGPHRGKHLMRTAQHIKEGKHIVGEKHDDKMSESEWLDGAGIPPGEHPVVEIKPKSLAEQEFGTNADKIIAGIG